MHTLRGRIADSRQQSGMSVEYGNVFASLEKALAICGQRQGGNADVESKFLRCCILAHAALSPWRFL